MKESMGSALEETPRVDKLRISQKNMFGPGSLLSL